MGFFSSLLGQSNGEEALMRAISVAYSREEEHIPTKIPWWEAEKFAEDRGVKVTYSGNSIYANIQMMVNNEKVVVFFSKDKNNDSTNVAVAKYSSL